LYGPMVQKVSRILPPRRSAAALRDLARLTVSLKPRTPWPVQFVRAINVGMRLTFPVRVRSDAREVLGSRRYGVANRRATRTVGHNA
jgi:hypothetical protein